MAIPNQGRIGEQNEAYRRGVVLGLTMAEAGILIIFVLLLLLVLGEIRYQPFRGIEPVTLTQLTQLKEVEKTLHQMAKELGVEIGDSSEDFIRLIRVVREAMQESNAKTALVEAKSALEDIKRAKEEVRTIVEAAQNGGGEEAAKRVEQQSFRIANQEGQLNVLEKKLVAAGQGKGERPCWVQPDGTIDYLYDIVLTSGGIKMREHVYAHRQSERALLQVRAVHPQEVLSESVFIARTKPLFQYSQHNNCRFFVVVYDATASNEKLLYKSLLRTVEGHFYKRLDYGPPPF